MKVETLAILIFLGSASLQADVIVCPALKDTSLYEGDPGNSNGGGPDFFAGTDGNKFRHRGLLAFDLSGIPAGATITNVQLTLTLAQVAGGGGGGGGGAATSATIGLYDLTQNWGEGTVNSGVAGINMTGPGAPASPGDATWDQAFYGTNGAGTAWTNPGGDYIATASASLYLGNNMTGMAFTWLSTPQLVADVQGWLNNPSTNFGWELINADETDARTFFAFYSREWDNTHFGGGASQVPALQVTYTPAVSVPLPAWASWATFPAIFLLAGRLLRRRPAASGKR